MTDASVKFVCCDCGLSVIALGCTIQVERCGVCHWIMQSVPLEQRAIVRERLGITLVPTPTPDTRTQPHHDASPASKPGRPEPQNNKQQKQQKQQYSNNGGMEPKAVDNSRKAE